MPTVYVRKNEDLSNALKRFSKYVEKERIISDFRSKEYFKNDSERRKEKQRRRNKRR